MKDNLGYDESFILASKQRSEVIHLKGIGKFCKCGCNKRIPDFIIKRRLNKTIKVRGKQEFATVHCKNKYYSKYYRNMNIFQSSKSISARINLEVLFDKEPYRIISLYLKASVKKEIRITPKDESLWNCLEVISRFRNVKSEKTLTEADNNKERTRKVIGEIKID